MHRTLVALLLVQSCAALLFSSAPMQQHLVGRTGAPTMLLKTKTKPKSKSQPAKGSLSNAIRGAGFEKEREVSDAETALRWIGVQGGVDFSILCVFAYHYNFDLETAINVPELKFLIIMPAFTVFCQILRRFGSEELPTSRTAFEDDPIVRYLGGVRSLLSRSHSVTMICHSLV